jgi:phosphate transport system protein
MRGRSITRLDSTREPAEIALRACLIAKDAAFNAKDYIATGSRMAFIAVQQCEKELDQIERQIDDSMPAAITEVTEPEARELLACLKFTIDLERIGDLIWSVARRIHHLPSLLNSKEAGYLTDMAETLQEMLARIHEGFLSRDLELAESVLGMDSEMDQACHSVFRQYLEKGAGRRSYEVTNLLFMAQAFERAGDHTKNLAEELVHLVEGHSVRHVKKTRLGVPRSRQQV